MSLMPTSLSWCPLRSPWGLSKCHCLRRPFDFLQAQVWSPWSPWDNDKSPEHPVECLSTQNMCYDSQVVSLVPQYHNLCPSTLQKCWISCKGPNNPFSGHLCLLRSSYPKRRSSNPTGDVMMDLDPWKSPGVVEVVEEAYESPCLMKKP